MSARHDESAVAGEEWRFGHKQSLEPVGKRICSGEPFRERSLRSQEFARRGLEDFAQIPDRPTQGAGAGKPIAKNAKVARTAAAKRETRGAARAIGRGS